ncbi:MAG: ribonuclease J [Anaerolineae bacterium]|nr:ribonuclease J [Anaerolineae bacterium]
MSDKIRIVPLGGLGEVGKNMMVIEYDRQILVIDAGLMFPENDMLGIDLVIPDFGYLMDKADQVQAIIVTHGHEDHIGALPYLLREINVPIYATALTRGLAEIKLRRHHILDQATFRTIRSGDRASIGPFEIEFFRVTHSIPDGVGLAIDTPAGLIVHSGDYKFDHTPVDGQPTDFARLASFGGRGVLALLADSTNSESAGFTPSERVVGEAFDAVCREAQGRIIVGTFASLISRIQQVMHCAKTHGRQVAIAGRTMVDNVTMSRALGYIDIPPDTLIPLTEIQYLPPDKVIIMATGTQGEPSAALAKMARQQHPQVRIQRGDTVIMSAQTIPGNEEMVHRTVNRLYQRGANVVYDRIAPVHVSGHASQEEQKLLINLIRPQYLIPIHGELRHLHAHARIAHELGMPRAHTLVVENGYVLEFSAGKASIGERVPGGYVFVDGTGVGDVGPGLLREREQLANDGFVTIIVPLTADDQLAAPSQIVTRGFIFQPESGELLEKIAEWAANVIDQCLPARKADLATVLRRELQDRIYDETKRRPMVIPALTHFTFHKN